MNFYILLDSQGYVLGGIFSDTQPEGYIQAQPLTQNYVRTKYDVINQVYYEGATEAEIDDYVRVQEEVLSIALEETDKYLVRFWLERRGNLDNIYEQRKALYDYYYAEILRVKPTYEIPTNDIFYIPFRITIEAEEDAEFVMIPIMFGITEIKHVTINKSTTIENPPYNPATGRVDIKVLAGDTLDFTI